MSSIDQSPSPSPDRHQESDYEPVNPSDDDPDHDHFEYAHGDEEVMQQVVADTTDLFDMEGDEEEDAVALINMPDVTAADINSTTEFVNLLSFCQVFAPVLMLPPFSFLELEQAIIFSRDDPLYSELAARCIYLGQNRKDALKPDQWQNLTQRIISGMKDSFVGFMYPDSNSSESYQSLLDKTVSRSESDGDLRPTKRKHQNSLLMQWTDDCHSLSPYARLLILSNLCDWACSESLEILKFISNVDPDQFRPEPQGRDSQDRSYWFFHSSVQSQSGRLYEQNNQGQVRLVAQTLDELICFLSEHDDGRDATLEPFLEYLRDDIIPMETAKAEAEQKKAQRLRRQGLLSDNRQTLPESRRSSTRPARFTFDNDESKEPPSESRGTRRSSRLA